MRILGLAGRASLVLAAVVFFVGITSARDGVKDHDEKGNKVRWRQIVGILSVDRSAGGFQGAPVPWTVRAGRAVVDLDTGRLKFRVVGLVIAAPVPAVPPGVATHVTKVRGTLVCNGTAAPPGPPFSDAADTPAVDLDAQGNAHFNGTVDIPSSCRSSNLMAFLIRIAETSVPLIRERWIAHGAVRVP